uniref:RINT1-like protein MAG2L isoform X2 n=1 Tax=Elaeis guineensis var. tenera TaxID=51953 RepID=A0A6I9QHE5_ELAGV|nr:RINT1-like protein MAG2L isoform X2 [Elaeis guineensis]
MIFTFASQGNRTCQALLLPKTSPLPFWSSYLRIQWKWSLKSTVEIGLKPPMEAPAPLPSSSALSCRLRRFLDDHFKALEDLSTAPSLVAQLNRECGDLETDLLCLRKGLSVATSTWLSRSDDVRRTLRLLDPGFEGYNPRPSRGSGGLSPKSPAPPYGEVEAGLPSVGRILQVELPLLVKEVGRIQTVRSYAETTLKLEALVGELEDATFAIMSHSRNYILFNHSNASIPSGSGQKQGKLMLAITSMKNIEEILASVARRRPLWNHLVMAVDSRVENTFSLLRPQALMDHRALLASLGWPPALSKSGLEWDKSLEIPNPLVLMEGEKKEIYSQSFVELCALQHLQAQREERLLGLLENQKRHKLLSHTNLDRQTCDYSLWTIDELVHPIASRMEYHFSRWFNEPKFIFALVYKITRDFMDGMDNVLQPLMDQARLVGSSAREAWVSAMGKLLTKYLERQVFPLLAKTYDARNQTMDVTSSWLQLVDLMISFDKRMKVLAASVTPLMGPLSEFEEFSRSLSILSIFNEHSNWLQTWAEIELNVADDKLKSELEDERSWFIDFRKQSEFSHNKEAESFLLSAREDYKAPPIVDSVIKIAWSMIERGQALPSKPMKIQFIRCSANIFLKHFFTILFERCQNIKFMAASIGDDELLRVAGAVNAARFCESVMREWSEDVVFLEMSADEDEQKGNCQHPHVSFFEDEINYLVELEIDCLEGIMSALLLEFDALCWCYVQNIEQWEDENIEFKNEMLDEELMTVSPGFVEALDMLKDRINILKLSLNSQDFLDLWRSIAGGLDHFIFRSIPLRDIKFSCQGVNQFRTDMKTLFLVFSSFCARPEAFFPFTSESLKLLTIHCKDADFLLEMVSKSESEEEECPRLLGLSHVTISQAKLIVRNRKFVR